jgi:hypothetical protein
MNNDDTEIETWAIGFDSYWDEIYYIHGTCDGTRVRSKSELVIYDCLYSSGIRPDYEKKLKINGNTKAPDFTIVNRRTGSTYYWEHLGMLHNSKYKEKWESKLKWYRENDILPYEEGGGKNGTLIVTRDDERGGLSSEEINNLIKEIFGGTR